MVEEVRQFPRWFYKAGEADRQCFSEEEAAALGEGWSDEHPSTAPGTEAAPAAPAPEAESEDGGEATRRRRT